jgi:hypothetical protein
LFADVVEETEEAQFADCIESVVVEFLTIVQIGGSILYGHFKQNWTGGDFR